MSDITASPNLNSDVQSQLNLWRIALDTSLNIVFFHDRQMNLIWANRAYLSEVNCKLEDVIHQPYWHFFPKGDGPMPGCQKTMDSQNSEEKDIELSKGRWFRASAYPILDQYHMFHASIHILQDISQFRLLKNAHELSHFATEHTSDALYLIDESSVIQYVNQAAVDMLGYSRKKLIHLKMPDIDQNMSPDDWSDNWQEMKKNNSLTFESEHRRKDGSVIPVRVSVNYHQHNKKDMYIAFVRNISDTRAYEQKLIENEENYRNLFEAMTSGVSLGKVIVNDKGEPVDYYFIEVNKAYENIVDLKQEHIIDRTILEIFPDIDRYWITKLGHVAIIGKPTQFHRYLPSLVKYLNVRAFSPEQGKVACVINDMTELTLTHNNLERKTAAFKTLSAINHLIIHAADEQELLANVCDTIVEEGVYPLAWIGVQQADGSLKIASNTGTGNVLLEQLDLSGKGDSAKLPLFKALKYKRSYVVQDIVNDSGCKICQKKALEYGLHCTVSIPFKFNNDYLAVLNVYGNKPFSISTEEELLLQELAQDLEYGLFSIRTHKIKESLSEELDETLVATIQAISTALEKRDPYTAGHQRRVAQLAMAIGRELKLSQVKIEGLQLGSMIHDIGKIYVPAEILSYPGKLNNDQFNFIKSHPSVGYDIVKDINFPWPIADMVHQHHERYDGTGYPNGIKGEDITLEARILAVADVVEAMASHRPYRPGLGVGKALDEIKSGSGSRYDSEIVGACLIVFEKNGFLFDADGLNS